MEFSFNLRSPSNFGVINAYFIGHSERARAQMDSDGVHNLRSH